LRRKLLEATLLALVLACIQEEWAYSEDPNSPGETIMPQSVGVFGNFYPVFQGNSPVLLPDGSTKKIYPFYQYFDLNAASPQDHITFNTFLRGREIFNGTIEPENSFDVYNAFFQYTTKPFDIRLGRQIITESTNLYLLDGGLVRINPIDGLQIVAYGGYQNEDAQPYPEKPQTSFSLYGVKLKSDRLLGALITVGYEGISPIGFSPRNFLNFTFNRVVPFTKSADVYARVEVDLGEKNLALFNGGIGITPFAFIPFHINLEYDTYKPDQDRSAFLQDRIFDLFSVSRLNQARVGATYIPTTFLKVSASYSFAHYDVLDGTSTNGNIVKVALSWDFWREIGLKSFQGFYFIDGGGNNGAAGIDVGDKNRAIGVNFGISEEILRGLDLQFSFAYANTQTITNLTGNSYSYIIGVQYVLIRNLVVNAVLEVNSNPQFNSDVRPNIGVSYHF
jgi:hypothetical protein